MQQEPPSKPEDEEEKKKIRIDSPPLTGLFVLAMLYTAYVARAILLPIVLAIFFTILLRPLVRSLKRVKIPEVAAAALILLAFLGIVGYGITLLSGPAEEWIRKAPANMQQILSKLKTLTEPAQKAQKSMEQLENSTGTQKQKEPMSLPSTGLLVSVATGVQQFAAKSAILLILLFFLLAAGDLLIVKILNLFREYRSKKEASDVVREVESAVSRYLLTVTMINATQGVLVAIALYFIGMPNPPLWGVMAAVLIYVPYIGPLVGISAVAVASALTFEEITKIILAPGIYLAIEVLQGQVVTPYILSARFTMNPVVVFLWLILWGWFWGVIGALIAVPMLVIFKICCDHVKPLRPVGDFLSD